MHLKYTGFIITCGGPQEMELEMELAFVAPNKQLTSAL